LASGRLIGFHERQRQIAIIVIAASGGRQSGIRLLAVIHVMDGMLVSLEENCRG